MINITDPEIQALFIGIDASIKHLSNRQIEILAKRLVASFIMGTNITGEKREIYPHIDISEMQQNAIRELTDTQMGYVMEFNKSLGLAMKDEVKAAMAEGKTIADMKNLMKPRIKELFGPNGQVVIDHTGQTRRIAQVGRDGSLRWFDKPITKSYTTSIENYSDMLSRTVVHGAYVKGRSVTYQASGLNKWRYMAMMDERTRPDHAALHGQIFKYGTPESEMAESIMQEPNCRCRQIAFFDDPELDSPQDIFEEEKIRAGVQFDDTSGEWTFQK